MHKPQILQNKWFRKTTQIFSLTTIAFVFQACYGPPQGRHNQDTEITIRILDDQNNPLPGIEININNFITRKTNADGLFYSFLPKSEEYKINVIGNDMYHSRDTVVLDDDQDISFDLKLEKK